MATVPSNEVATVASPSKQATSCSGKVSRMMREIQAETFGVISVGLTIAVLPAASASTSGSKLSVTG